MVAHVLVKMLQAGRIAEAVCYMNCKSSSYRIEWDIEERREEVEKIESNNRLFSVFS